MGTIQTASTASLVQLRTQNYRHNSQGKNYVLGCTFTLFSFLRLFIFVHFYAKHLNWNKSW